jgi:hypothetical protein
MDMPDTPSIIYYTYGSSEGGDSTPETSPCSPIIRSPFNTFIGPVWSTLEAATASRTPAS